MSFWPDPINGRTDMISFMRSRGMTKYAMHCPKCGKWSHVLAGNDSADGPPWYRTICKDCGVWETDREWKEGKEWKSNSHPVKTWRLMF